LLCNIVTKSFSLSHKIVTSFMKSKQVNQLFGLKFDEGKKTSGRKRAM
jgi:hypothetical protein